MAVPQCKSWEFQCRNGGCVQSPARCDGRFQCEDGSDEKGCTNLDDTEAAQGRCGAQMYQCGDGQCIFSEWRCDSEVDCRDGADEKHCNQKADITVLSNIAGAAIASTVAVVIIGFAIASVVHLYRKRKKHEESLQARPIVRPPPGYSDDLGFYPHVVPGPLPYVLRNEPPPFYTSQELLISAGSVTDPTIQSAYLLPPYSVREARIVEPPPDYFGNAPGVHNMTPLTNEGITVVTHMADHTSAGQGELRADVMEAERTIDSDDEEST